MSVITLGTGETVTIDRDDFARCSSRVWSRRRMKSGHVYVADKNGTMIHRFIMRLRRGQKLFVDHINGNGLDNRKSNLRVCTPAENNLNARPHRHKKYSKHKGVTFDRRQRCRKKPWRASIARNGSRKVLGYFKSELAAARAYRKAAREIHGEFAFYG